MNDAAVVDEIEPDLVEQVDADPIEEEVEDDSEEVGELEEDNEPSESSTEKKDDSFQERIDELVAKHRSEERARIDAESNARALKEQIAALQAAPKVDEGKKLEDFDYDEGRFANYLTQLAEQRAEEKTRARAEQARTAERRSKFTSLETAFAREVPDYYQIAHYSPITPEIGDILMGAEKGPELAYYLGTNTDVARKLCEMHPLDAARELGRIEATKLVKPEKSTTKAPDPAPKLKTGGKVTTISSDSPESDKLSDAEWLRRENKRLAAKGR